MQIEMQRYHDWKLKNQFDTNHKKFNDLAEKYNLNISNYFQLECYILILILLIFIQKVSS